MVRLTPGSFSVGELGSYPGFTTEAEPAAPLRPLFTPAVAERVVSDWLSSDGHPEEPPGEPPRQLLYLSDADAFRLFDPATRAWHEFAGEAYGCGVRTTLYPIGAGLWPWRRAEPFRRSPRPEARP